MIDAPLAHLDRLLIDGDLDGLLRLVEDSCETTNWEILEQIATRSRLAADRGHQLWPAADHAEHRLALEAPACFAAAAVIRDATTFGVAPLAEVAASSHTWAELDPFLPVDAGPLRALVAHERVARGEDLFNLELTNDPMGLPLRLAAWELISDGPAIGPYAVDDPVPKSGPLTPSTPPDAGRPLTGPRVDAACDALRDLVSTWTEQSRGTATSVAVAGTGPQAALAASQTSNIGLRPLASDEAVGLLAWAGASAGAQGRRRGAARGRFEAWWCATALTGLDGPTDSWPPDPNELGDAVAELRWWRWDDVAPGTGWFLGIAVEDPLDGLSWALAASDHLV